MSQVLGVNSIEILKMIKHEGKINPYAFIKRHYDNESYRRVFTQIYQLEKRGYLEKYKHKDVEFLRVSQRGEISLQATQRIRENKWKIIIFDIPETNRSVRDFLRSKIKQLGFKKWQNGVWITPYKIPSDVQDELQQLSEKYFVRVITVDSVNNDSDLKTLFP